MIGLIAALVMQPPLQLRVEWDWRAGQGSLLSMVKDPGKPYLYCAMNEGGVVILRTEKRPTGQRVAGTISRKALGGLDATHVLLKDSTLYVALGNFFNPRGSKFGVAAVDVSRPDEPKVVTQWTSPESERGASGLALRGDVLAMGLMSKGVALFDVGVPGKIELLGRMQPDPNFPHPKPKEPRVPNARGLTFDGDLLYVANDAGGLRVVDCKDVRAPVEIGRYIQQGMLKKQQAYNNVVIEGTLAFLAVDYAGVEIVDISDPKNIKAVAWWNPWHAERMTNMWFNSPGHTNQLALDRARRRLYVSAGDSELCVLDVRDPAKPKLVSQYGLPKNNLATWGLEMTENEVYLSYINAVVPFRGTWSGVKALRR